jgi:WD40 repeat protein
LAVIQGGSVFKQIQAHKRTIFAICNSQDLQTLFTGGADGKVIVWNKDLKVTTEISVNSNNFVSINPKVRAIDFDSKSN